MFLAKFLSISGIVFHADANRLGCNTALSQCHRPVSQIRYTLVAHSVKRCAFHEAKSGGLNHIMPADEQDPGANEPGMTHAPTPEALLPVLPV